MKKGLISCVSVCLLLLVWQLIASSMDQPELIPSVPELIKALFQLFGTDTFYKSISAPARYFRYHSIIGSRGDDSFLICPLRIAL